MEDREKTPIEPSDTQEPESEYLGLNRKELRAMDAQERKRRKGK